MKRCFLFAALFAATAVWANGDKPPADPAFTPPKPKLDTGHTCRKAYRAEQYEKAMTVCMRFPDDPEAQYYIGRMYEKGEGVPSDMMRARPWYEKSAHAGYGRAQFRLAGAYAHGLAGLEKDEAKAVEWLKRAASNDDERAQEYLAEGYERGLLGLPKDSKQAKYWRDRLQALRDAAEQRKQNRNR